jgi:hypothetical protein
MAHFEHGALDKTTGRLIDPHTAAKRTLYECPDCKRNVFARKGEIRVAHFSHCKDVENACSYFNRNPSRDQQHKNAQLKLRQFIEQGVPIEIRRPCMCKQCGISAVFLLARGKALDVSPTGVRYSETATVRLEHRFQFNGSTKIADVAVLNDNNIACVIEVVHAHYTREADRPEPWYEFMAKEINAISSDATEITLTCVRQKRTLTCIMNETRRQQELRERAEKWKIEREEFLKTQREKQELLEKLRRDAEEVRRKEMEEEEKKWRKHRAEEFAKREEELRKEEELKRQQLEAEMKSRKPIVTEIEKQRRRAIILEQGMDRIESSAPLCRNCKMLKRKKPSLGCCASDAWAEFVGTELPRIYRENGLE